MFDINQLRQQNIMDQFGGGGGNYMDYGMDDQSSQQPVLPSRPIFQPFEQSVMAPRPIQPPSIQMPTVNAPQRPTGVAPSPSYQDLANAMDTLYTPSTVDRDRNRGLLDAAPVRQRPGIATKFAASLSALGKGGLKDAQTILYSKGDKELEDWKTKTQPFYQAAALEGTANNTERTMAGNMITSKTQADTQASRERIAAETQRINEQKNNDTAQIARERNAIENARVNGAKFETKGEYIIATYPNGQAINTGVKTTNFSPFELENLRQNGRMALEGAKHTGDMDEIAARGAEARTTKGTAPAVDPNRRTGGNTSAAGNTPAAQRTARNNRFRALWDSNPELRPYIVKPSQTNGDWALANPPQNGMVFNASKEDQAAYERARQAIEGNTSGGNSVPSNAWVQRSPSTGARRYSIDGGKTWKPYPE